MVATAMQAFARVFRRVVCGFGVVFAQAEVDDEGIAGDFVPCSRQPVLREVEPLCDDMQMDVPTTVTATAFDLDEEYAALLSGLPLGTATQLHEGRVQSIDILLQGTIGVSEGEGDEPEVSSFSKRTDASTDMSSPLS